MFSPASCALYKKQSKDNHQVLWSYGLGYVPVFTYPYTLQSLHYQVEQTQDGIYDKYDGGDDKCIKYNAGYRHQPPGDHQLSIGTLFIAIAKAGVFLAIQWPRIKPPKVIVCNNCLFDAGQRFIFLFQRYLKNAHHALAPFQVG